MRSIEHDALALLIVTVFFMSGFLVGSLFTWIYGLRQQKIKNNQIIQQEQKVIQ